MRLSGFGTVKLFIILLAFMSIGSAFKHRTWNPLAWLGFRQDSEENTRKKPGAGGEESWIASWGSKVKVGQAEDVEKSGAIQAKQKLKENRISDKLKTSASGVTPVALHSSRPKERSELDAADEKPLTKNPKPAPTTPVATTFSRYKESSSLTPPPPEPKEIPPPPPAAAVVDSPSSNDDQNQINPVDYPAPPITAPPGMSETDDGNPGTNPDDEDSPKKPGKKRKHKNGKNAKLADEESDGDEEEKDSGPGFGGGTTISRTGGRSQSSTQNSESSSSSSSGHSSRHSGRNNGDGGGGGGGGGSNHGTSAQRRAEREKSEKQEERVREFQTLSLLANALPLEESEAELAENSDESVTKKNLNSLKNSVSTHIDKLSGVERKTAYNKLIRFVLGDHGKTDDEITKILEKLPNHKEFPQPDDLVTFEDWINFTRNLQETDSLESL